MRRRWIACILVRGVRGGCEKGCEEVSWGLEWLNESREDLKIAWRVLQ